MMESDSPDAVRVRSNVTVGQHDSGLEPGEIVQKHRPITDQIPKTHHSKEQRKCIMCHAPNAVAPSTKSSGMVVILVR